MVASSRKFLNLLLIAISLNSINSYCTDYLDYAYYDYDTKGKDVKGEEGSGYEIYEIFGAEEGSGYLGESEIESCFCHCNNKQGSCPQWCGEDKMCCTKNPDWNDTSNGCDGTFGGEQSHECVTKPQLPNIPLKLHNEESSSSFHEKKSRFVCNTTGILINISTHDGLKNQIWRQTWCEVPYSHCFGMIENSAFFIDGVIMVIIASIGIMMNILFCYVLSRRELSNSFNSLLISLAVIDNFFLIGLILQSFRFPFKLSSNLHTYLFTQFLTPLRHAMLYSSIFLTLAISVERYNAVTRPIRMHLKLKHKKRANLKIVMMYVVPVLTFSLIFTIPKFLETETSYDEKTGDYYISATELRTNQDYIIYYIGLARFIVTGIIPFSMILFFNLRTYRTIQSRKKHELTKNDDDQPSKTKLNENAGYVGHPIWALILSWASHILLALNSSLNSAIYCVFSSKYREQARKTFAFFLK